MRRSAAHVGRRATDGVTGLAVDGYLTTQVSGSCPTTRSRTPIRACLRTQVARAKRRVMTMIIIQGVST